MERRSVSSSAKLELNTIGTPSRGRRTSRCSSSILASIASCSTRTACARLERNPLRILDSKNPELAELIDAAPLLSDYLDDESRAHFERVQTLLGDVGVAFTLNPRLVRGLDYYSRTVFEWLTDRLGAQSAICSGGRYDGLVGAARRSPTPGGGWALGIERIVELMQADGIGSDEMRRRTPISLRPAMPSVGSDSSSPSSCGVVFRA